MESENRYFPDSPRWQGHTYDDDCPPEMEFWEGKPLIGFTVANAFAKRTLKEFFATGSDEPLRVLEPGETFDGNSYAEGTVVLFQQQYPSEDLIDDVDEYDDRTTYWGVVCGYNEGGKRVKTLLSYKDAEIKDDTHIPNPGGRGDLVMTVGVVRHTRDADGTINNITRVDAVEIYQHGVGVKQERGITQLLRTLKAVTTNS